VTVDMKKGDRVTVVITARRPSGKPMTMHGEIIGESRDAHAWIIKRDDVKTPCAYHKTFCHHPEEVP
jgi:hypothetical protein